MKYEHMTKNEAKDYLQELELLAEESGVDENWFFSVEEETGRYYIGEDEEVGVFIWGQDEIDKARSDLKDLIEEVTDYVEHYDEREKEYEDYKHMVGVESRYW